MSLSFLPIIVISFFVSYAKLRKKEEKERTFAVKVSSYYFILFLLFFTFFSLHSFLSFLYFVIHFTLMIELSFECNGKRRSCVKFLRRRLQYSTPWFRFSYENNFSVFSQRHLKGISISWNKSVLASPLAMRDVKISLRKTNARLSK